MCKASQILRKPVVVGRSGEHVGRVTNLIFDDRSNRVLGMIVDRTTIFGRMRVLPFRDILMIGPDVIIARDRDALVRPRQVPEMGRIDRRSAVKGKPLITADGRMLGRIADLRVDERTGAIEAYELSMGSLPGVLAKRNVLAADEACSRATRRPRRMIFVTPSQGRSFTTDLEEFPPKLIDLTRELTAFLQEGPESLSILLTRLVEAHVRQGK